MHTLSLFSLAVSSLSLIQVSAQGWIYDHALDPLYPYVVHLPINVTDQLPPCVVNLGGKGSMFEEGVTFPVESTISYGLSGWLVDSYLNGTINPSTSIVAQQFVTIVPYQYLWYGDNLTWEAIRGVVDDAQTKYPFDTNRIYITGYSAGARAVWPIIASDPTFYAAAAIMAGTPYPDMSYVGNLTTTPLRIYGGALDYETESASQQWQETAYYNAIQSAGGNQVELVILPNGTHNSMQQDPYTIDLYEWFLLHDTTPNQPLPTAPLLAQAYDEAVSVNSISAAANAFSIYQDGFLPGQQPLETPATIAAEMAAASSAWSAYTATASRPASLGQTASMIPIGQVIKDARSAATPRQNLSLLLAISMLFCLAHVR